MATLLAACSDEQTEVDRATDKEEAFPVTEARAFVESLMTQRTRGEAEEESFFIHGDFICDWDAAQFSSGRVQYSQVVAIASDYDYFRYHVDSTGKPFLTPIYHKLVVIEEQETGLQGAFVRYYVPDPVHALSHDAAYYDALLNSNRKTDFTGYSLYTDLDGWVVTVGYYSEGDLMQYASFADQQYSAEENMERMEELLGVMAVARKPHQAATRGSDTGEEPSIKVDIEGVETVGWRREKDWSHILYMLSLLEDTQPKIKKEDHKTELDNGGGGGGENPNIPTGNERLKTSDPDIINKLADLLADCLGQKAIGSIAVDVEFQRNPSIKYMRQGMSNQPDPQTGQYRFTIEYNQVSDYMLLEELIHVNQAQWVTPDWRREHLLNLEVEAKIGVEKYLEDHNIQKKPEVFGTTDSRFNFQILKTLIEDNAAETEDFYHFYNLCAEGLRNITSYSDPNRYPLQENYYGTNTIQQLMKDC